MSDDLQTPDGLNRLGRIAVQVILETAKKVLEREVLTGGCKAFYSPEEWEDRGEAYGLNSKLIVVHDGGDLSTFFSHLQGDYGAMKVMADALREKGLYAEQCTGWYTAVYKVR